MSNLVIYVRQCLLAGNFPQAVNVRRHIRICQNIRISDIPKRDMSVNANNDPPLPDPKSDADVNKKIEFIKLELESFRHRGIRVPRIDSIKQTHWDELLKLGNASARRKYYNFLFDIEVDKENDKVSVTLAVKSLTN